MTAPRGGARDRSEDVQASGLSDRHWARRAECTSVWGIRFLLAVHALFGRAPFLTFLTPVLLFYWCTRPALRRASLRWLERAGVTPTHANGLRHLTRFAETMLDKFLASAGRFSADSLCIENDDPFQNDPPNQGCILLTSHTGCQEILQARSSAATKHPIVVLQYTSHARRFNELLEKAGATKNGLIFYEVGDVTPGLAMELDEHLQKGAYLVIAGDRIPTGSEKAVTLCSFMGQDAPFPTGGAFLAMLLHVPLRMMTCTRADDVDPRAPRYRVRFESLCEETNVPRRERRAFLKAVTKRYAAHLETEMRAHPYDWFNFHDFWQEEAR